jgi:PHD/YefM family antitoxin component YafN of YafNO toxin-antitoxin module
MEVVMINIRPVSDLRNKYAEIEAVVSNGEHVFLTKNGYGAMVVMNLLEYESMASDYINRKLDEADRIAAQTDIRYTHEEVFNMLRDRIDGKNIQGEL